MGNLGVVEIIVIVVIALLVFGPERLPELARQAGKMISRFREETSRSVEELKRAADVEDLDRELKGLTREIRDVRSTVTRTLTESTRRPPDSPPPFDPEAT